MNQPAEDLIKQIKERQAEFEKRLIEVERYISPIKFTQMELDSGRIFRRLDEIQENTNTTKIQMDGARSDLLKIRESQVDLRDRLKEHSEDLKAIKDKQEAHTELLGQLMNFGERIEATMATKNDIKHMATKDDISALKGDIGRIEGTQQRQEQLLQAILDRLPPKL